MYKLNEIKAILSKVSDDKIVESITKGVLKLSADQINTILYVFCICYLAERDLEYPLTNVWSKLLQISTPEAVSEAKDKLNQFLNQQGFGPSLDDVLMGVPEEIAIKIKDVFKKRYNEKIPLDINNLSTFGEKIKVYEKIFTKNNVSSILWKIKNIRDDISHGRIDELKYEGKSLSLRETKEKLLIDYLTAVSKPEHSQSQLRDKFKLTEEENNAAISLLKKL